MERFAARRRVFLVEEAIPTAHHLPYLEFHAFPGTTVTAVRPRLSDRLDPAGAAAALAGLMEQMGALVGLRAPVLWFYSPMFWPSAQLLVTEAAAVVHDCMDERAAFDFAPPGLRETEAALLCAADLLLTGGQALFEAKRPLHDNVHAFLSSIDHAHFPQARETLAPPPIRRSSRPRASAMSG